MAVNLAPKGIRVNAVFAGGKLSLNSSSAHSSNVLLDHVDSGLVDQENGNSLSIPTTNHCGLNKTGSVHEVASAIKFLASDDASFVTGQTICVDGGASLRPKSF